MGVQAGIFWNRLLKVDAATKGVASLRFIRERNPIIIAESIILHQAPQVQALSSQRRFKLHCAKKSRENIVISKALGNIALSDLDALIVSGAVEGRTLEFKLELPGPKDDDVREFLADVTSFANTDGGDLIFGIKDKDGVAVARPGAALATLSAEGTELRLENLLRTAVQPRLSGVRFRWLEISPSHSVLIIRIPASLAAPHRVTFKGGARFHHRNGRGKAEMDTHELRLAFTASEALPTRLSQLHQDAVRMVIENDLPFSMSARPKAIVTVLPLNVLRDPRTLDIDHETAVYPPHQGGISWLHALEGFYLFNVSADAPTDSFALTRRSGQVDICWSIGRESIGERLIWPFTVEKLLKQSVSAATSKLAHWDIEGPFVVSLTLIGIKGYRLFMDTWIGNPPAPAWRSQLTIPSVVIESSDEASLMPVAEAFWYAMNEKRPDGRALGFQG